MWPQQPQPVSYLTVLPNRRPNPSNPHPQHQSTLFSRLPGEIRNRIYTYVFTTSSTAVPTSTSTSTSTSTTPPPSPHALSLLLTCQRIHNEAAIPAFETHTFPLSHSIQPTYPALRTRTAHLPAAQRSAITSLSVRHDTTTGALLAHALILFPRLSQFSSIIVLPRSSKSQKERSAEIHAQQSTPATTPAASDPTAQAAAHYAPHALTHILPPTTSSTISARPAGAQWRVTWPQAESGHCYSRISCVDGRVSEELVMDASAVDSVEGVRLCICGCGEVCWTDAILSQDSGREVRIGIVYHEEQEQEPSAVQPRVDSVPSVDSVPGVVLVPGVKPAGDVVRGTKALGYEADEYYWEALRRRNGQVGAPWWRDVWGKTMGFENASYSKLTAGKKDGFWV